jgi:DNA helicase-2/ATP-dependent DNA helicase PcrA
MDKNAGFKEAYKSLNTKQKEAVDTIDGPVMVVAGPGTGKTQVLALRIANILKQTDTHADGILCLTFTKAGVSEMRDRLRKYIGADSSKLQISTFHSFGMKIIEEHYAALGLNEQPQTLDESDGIALCDGILHENEWQYLRPRGDASRYFRDLKSLISLLKRERLSPENFKKQIDTEIKNLEENPDNISSRGESKGKLKKEVERNIEGLSRTREVVTFYSLYEEAKKEKNFFDYDDILENLVKIVELSDDVAASIREKYLYILIDEHQDSSGVQNEFLEKVWGEVEKPNIFVVGDDRQLIYGFGGASLAYFEGFKNAFGKAKLITLVDNYRSTQNILDASHELLQSSITQEKLQSKNSDRNKESHPIKLVEAQFERDEIIACGLAVQQKITEGIDPNHIAVLVPKNRHVRSAVTVLVDMGIPVSVKGSVNFFDVEEAQSLLRVLRIIVDPYDTVALSGSLFDPLSGILPLEAHKFIKETDIKKFSLETDTSKKDNKKQRQSLFENESNAEAWLGRLRGWLLAGRELDVYKLIQKVSDEFLLVTAENHDELLKRVEVVRTFIHLVLLQSEKNKKPTLKDFIYFLDRLESYGEHIPLAVFAKDEGVKVLTLHGSKGLEFDFVWVAHMDEKSLMSGKRNTFTLPEVLEEKVEKKDVEIAKRELYVAITRAKRFCTISYATESYTGGELELAHIIADLPEEIFAKQTKDETEKILLAQSPKIYTQHNRKNINIIDKDTRASKNENLQKLTELVKSEYEDRKVSVSLLNNFFECHWKWYFRNLLQLPEMTSEYLEFGNKIHNAIDEILQMDHKLTAKEIEVLTNSDKEVLGVISTWVKNRLPEISLNRENEQSVSVNDERFPHLNIYGRIDLIEKLDKESLRVTDFKTGSVHKKSEIEKLDEEGRLSNLMRQLTMYSYLLQQSSKWKKDVRESRLEFVEAKNQSESLYNTVIQPEQIKLLIKDIEDYDNLLKTGQWLDRECRHKSYGKDVVCEYCALAKRIYK